MYTRLAQDLQKLLDRADLDAALGKVLAQQSAHTLDFGETSYSDPELLRYANLASEVLDYGGRYDDAERVIKPFLPDAKRLLETLISKQVASLSATDATVHHRSCYVLINGGMSVYRHARHDREEFNKAHELFALAEQALTRLETLGYYHRGALSRVWYCIGLIHRELYKYSDARLAFSKSIEAGAQALAMMTAGGQQEARYQYAMSRCYGLGNAWISYNEASLSEAKCHIVAARLLLKTANARYIAAYINFVYATIVLSSDSTTSVIWDGISELCKAYDALGGDEAVNTVGVGHGPYAIRLANELASAYVRYSQKFTGKEHADHCATALAFVQKVWASPHVEYDDRSSCKSHVLASRIYRENGDFEAALKSAKLALEKGGEHEFSRVDCWLTLGEAHFYTKNYTEAVRAFETALKFGAANRKIFAACHLHLSRTYLNSNEPSKARDHFNTWESTGRRALENVFIRTLGEEVENGIKTIERDFILSAKETQLTAEKHVNNLRNWLAKLALSRTGNDNPKSAAALLGVSESTVANWLKLDSDGAANRRRRGSRVG